MTSRTSRGSVAAARRAVPESTVKHRNQIRKSLAAGLPVVHALARSAEYRLPARDPESALVYVRELRDLCSEILAKLDP